MRQALQAATPACQACIFVTCNNSASPRHRGCSGCCRETLYAAGLSIAFRLLQLFPLPGDRHLDMLGCPGSTAPQGRALSLVRCPWLGISSLGQWWGHTQGPHESLGNPPSKRLHF